MNELIKPVQQPKKYYISPESEAVFYQNENPVWATRSDNQIHLNQQSPTTDLIGYLPVILPENLGDPEFRQTYGLKFAGYVGAMANAISSEKMVIEMAKAGFMATFGSGGLLPDRIERAIHTIRAEVGENSFLMNLLNSPLEPALEERTVELYIKHQIRAIEASAYLAMTKNLVWYRAAGLKQTDAGETIISNRVIAKISRKEIAKRFLEPAPADLVQQLVVEGKITELQAKLAGSLPMADDITVEADSGGHTDNRPLVSVLPAIIRLRNQIQKERNYQSPVRIGAAGGIATPSAALAAFQMGAAYIVTGSINQSCIESGASEHTRKLLTQAEMTDVTMAPASDMFEMGVKVQVLKRGTMFAMRGQKLYELYSRFDSLVDIPAVEREKLEKTIFKMSLDEVWKECIKFFSARDPRQIERATLNPKDKMGLVFRWYLGLSSRWSNIGEPGREMDYQIWTGPAMGAFNDWVKGTYLEEFQNRTVADVNLQIFKGAAYLTRIRMAEAMGLPVPANRQEYVPQRN